MGTSDTGSRPAVLTLTAVDGTVTVYDISSDDLDALLSRCTLVPRAPAQAQDMQARAVQLASLLHMGTAVHWSLLGGRTPDPVRLTAMCRRLLERLESGTKRFVEPQVGLAVHLQQATYTLFAAGKIKMSMDIPGFPFLLKSLAVLILNSWFRNNRIAIYKEEDLTVQTADGLRWKGLPDSSRKQILRHGVRAKDKTLCPSIAFNAFMALKIAGEGGQVLPMLADGTPAHNMTDYFKTGSHAIDEEKVYALTYLREALTNRDAA